MVEMKVKEDEKSNKMMDELEVMKDDWRWLTIKFKSEKDDEWIYPMMRSGIFQDLCHVHYSKCQEKVWLKNEKSKASQKLKKRALVTGMPKLL